MPEMNTKKPQQTQAARAPHMKKSKKPDAEPASESEQSSPTLMSSLSAECEKVRTQNRQKPVYQLVGQKIRKQQLPNWKLLHGHCDKTIHMWTKCQTTHVNLYQVAYMYHVYQSIFKTPASIKTPIYAKVETNVLKVHHFNASILNPLICLISCI